MPFSSFSVRQRGENNRLEISTETVLNLINLNSLQQLWAQFRKEYSTKTRVLIPTVQEIWKNLKMETIEANRSRIIF